jgi:AraC-like DNA-binding protein
MKAAIFNLDDIPLLLVVFECLMLAILLVVINHGKTVSNIFLALFLAAWGLDALDTIIYWSPHIKNVFLTDMVHIFFVFKFSVYLKAPMLFLYARSLIYSDYTFTWREALHLLPLALSPFYLMLLYSSLGDAQVYAATRDYQVLFNNPFFQGHLWARNIVYVFYGAMSYHLLITYKEHLEQSYSNIDKIDHSWLRLLIVGFIAIWVWNFSGYVLDLLLEPIWLPDIMGIIGNYFNFIFINALVLHNLINSTRFQGVQSRLEVKRVVDPETIDQRHIAILTKAMEEDKIFLEPEITLEQLAERVGLPPRQVSTIINRHFKKNFFEFVNHYRVEQAKQLLTQADQPASILDVMADAGFNSKSAFNRYFKKFVNMTPTEFRDSVLARQG